MLAKLKNRHIKRILWMLLILIIPAFVLWGSLSYMSSREKNIMGKIKNHKITVQEFHKYIKLARIYNLLVSLTDKTKAPSPSAIESQAWTFYLLLWQAGEDKTAVSNEEVISLIRGLFSRNGKFDREWYNRLVQNRFSMSPRQFEEAIRDILKIEKVQNNKIKISVSEEEILNAYKKDNETAKIAYIFLPFENPSQTVRITEEELKGFYEQNKTTFKEPAKVKLRYVFLTKEKKESLSQTQIETLNKSSDIDSLSEGLSLESKETGFLTPESPIEGIGWAKEIIASALTLPLNTISSPVEINNGILIFEKTAEKEPSIPDYESVKNKINDTLTLEKNKELAKNTAEKIIAGIKEYPGSKDLEDIAKKENLEYKETNYFKYYSYIEGVGLDKDLSEAIFSGEKGEIIPGSFSLSKGNYIVQIQDIVPIDQEKFRQEKQIYQDRIRQQKQILGRLQLLSSLEKDLGLKIYSSFFKQ